MDRSLESLIESRKRKAGDDSSDAISSKARRWQHPTDLGSILRPTKLPPEKFRTIQGLLNDKDEQIHDLRSELSEMRADVEVYRSRIEQKHRDLGAAKKQLEGTVSARELRERKQYYEEFIEDQNQIMALGRKVLADKTEQVKRFEDDNRQLRSTIQDQDARILQLSTAPADELAEAQAQRTLAMVRGLLNDVADRDTRITSLRTENNGLLAAKNAYKSQIDDLNKKVEAHKRGQEFAENQATQSKGIMDDQAKLITKLMAENARLVANQKM